MGNILKIGDSVLGYKLKDTNINGDNFEKLDQSNYFEVFLVEEHYATVQKGAKDTKIKKVS